AALLAFLPLHVRLSASETMQLLPSLFQLVALFAVAVHARTGDRAALAAGALASMWASLTRPEGASIWVALPFLYLGPGERRRPLRPSWLAIVAGAGLVTLPLYYLGVVNKLDARVVENPTLPIPQAVASAIESLRSSGWPSDQLVWAAPLGVLVLLLQSRA